MSSVRQKNVGTVIGTDGHLIFGLTRGGARLKKDVSGTRERFRYCL